MALRVAHWTGLSLLLAVGLAVSACGSTPGSEPASQIVPELQAAALRASSVHVTGLLIEKKQTTTLNVSIKGSSVAGYVGPNSTPFYVLSLNGQSYVKLSAAFLNSEKAPASLCATVCGKYVALPPGSTTQITNLLSMQQLDQQVFLNRSMTSAAGSSCDFSPATVHGQPVLQCRQGNSTLDVAAHGVPYLLYWTGPSGQHLAFTQWNSVVLPAAPPPSEVVSASDLS